MLFNADCLEVMRSMEAESIDCCVTSPPYYGLRDYGTDGQIGLELTLEEYIQKMIEVFHEVKRLLTPDGTLWLNMGDSYAGSGKGGAKYPENAMKYKQGTNKGMVSVDVPCNIIPNGLKPKDLMGVPWRVAFALQADGWYLRQDIIWSKPNPMPESVTDRCTKSHEYIFLLSKNKNYYFDSESMKEKAPWNPADTKFPDGWDTGQGAHGTIHPTGREKGKRNNAYSFARNVNEQAPPGQPKQHRESREQITYLGIRNKRDVWTISTQPFKGAHFATFPKELIRPCIKAGCPVGGTVLDPFIGSGTTAVVCIEENRDFVGIEINTEYCEIAKERIEATPQQARLFDEAKED